MSLSASHRLFIWIIWKFLTLYMIQNSYIPLECTVVLRIYFPDLPNGSLGTIFKISRDIWFATDAKYLWFKYIFYLNKMKLMNSDHYLWLLISLIPFIWYPNRSAGLSLQNLLMMVIAVLVTCRGKCIWSMPRRMML